MDAAVQTWNLTKRYEELVAVDRLNLTVNKGEIFGLLGPNGAGKTTTILMLMGLTEPTSGQARVYGYDPIREPLRVKRLAGYLAENFGFYEDLTAEQNLSYIARLNGIPFNEAKEKIYDLLDLVGLSDVAEMEVSKFSRGMKQRLGMADILLKNPEVLFLDEPTAGIDPEGVRRILDIIVKLSREDGKTILVSSHLLYQVQRICDRVGIFVKGRMVAEGPIQRLGR
ncbi:MAG: ABC transporter ATP-binding protein, partial [Candidatus Geothermarchaeales archaeon]